MSKKLFFNILLISVIFSLLSSISETLIFSYGSSHAGMTSEDWQKMETMNYREAINYMGAHSKKMNGFDILMEYFSSPFMFFHYLKMSLRFFIPILLTAFVIAFRVMKIKGIKKLSG